jgi:hypothetical protein
VYREKFINYIDKMPDTLKQKIDENELLESRYLIEAAKMDPEDELEQKMRGGC